MREHEGVVVPDLSPLPGRNRRLDLDSSNFSRGIVAVAAPRPVFGSRDQAAMDRVAVDVLQFLDAFLGSPDVEVVIPSLPEVFARVDLSPCDGLLDGLDRCGQYASLRLAHQQVNVLGHDYVSIDEEPVLHSRLFEGLLEHLRRSGPSEKRLSPVTTERNEMKTAGVLEALEAPRHGWRITKLGLRNRDE